MEKKQKYLPADEVALFCDQMAMVLKAGIPIQEGIETLCNSYENSRYASRFQEIRKAFISTGALYSALKSVELFPPYMVSMVKMGESTGKLDEVMSSLSAYYEWEWDTMSSIRKAVVYPTVLIFMMAVVVLILVVSVLPVFRRVFAGLGADAAANTTGMMALGVSLGKAILIIIAAFLLLLPLLFLLLRTNKRDGVIEFLKRISPPIRRVAELLNAGRFAFVVATMLRSGNNIDAALEVACDVADDARFKRAVLSCAALSRGGTPFAAAVEQAGIFESLHQKMIQVGAASGQLDAVMMKLISIYQDKADESIHYLVTLIEPILVGVLSVVIGGILLSVMLPLLGILSSMA